MPMRSVVARLLAVAVTFALPLAAQTDVAALLPKVEAAASRVQTAITACERALAAVRAAIGDADNKVQGDCDEIANVLKGGTFDGGLGVVPIALDHLDYVAEDKRAATRTALEALREQLQAGSLALLRLEALQELVRGLEFLAGLGPDDDPGGLLTDLAASTGKATRTQALPRADLAALQQQLATRRAQHAAKLGKELLTQARSELDALQVLWAELKGQMEHADANERDRGFARFDEAARSIRTALARVPAADRAEPTKALDAMQREADARYGAAYGAATATRMQETWSFTADQFTGWQDEAPALTTQGYLDFDPPGADVLTAPRTVALVGRANAWFAFALADADYRRNQTVPAVAAFTASVEALRRDALAKLLPVAEAVVGGAGAVDLADERLRGRLQTLADWDLPLTLQLHPQLPALRARVHTLLDAHDVKTLGADVARGRIREQALTTADGIWPRLQACLPVEGGFEPALAELFVGRLMRLEGVWLRSDEFAPGAHHLVFDLGGHVFAATMPPALLRDVAAARARLQLPGERPLGDAPCELLAVVGAATQVTLLGRDGARDGIVVPARALQLVGLRQGAVFALAP